MPEPGGNVKPFTGWRSTTPAALPLLGQQLRLVLDERCDSSGVIPLKVLGEVLDPRGGYYDFPREHWKSLRKSNSIESTFDPMQFQTRATRRMRTARTGLYLVFQLVRRAERRWRRIDTPHLVAKVREGAQFTNGQAILRESKRRVAA